MPARSCALRGRSSKVVVLAAGLVSLLPGSLMFASGAPIWVGRWRFRQREGAEGGRRNLASPCADLSPSLTLGRGPVYAPRIRIPARSWTRASSAVLPVRQGFFLAPRLGAVDEGRKRRRPSCTAPGIRGSRSDPAPPLSQSTPRLDHGLDRGLPRRHGILVLPARHARLLPRFPLGVRPPFRCDRGRPPDPASGPDRGAERRGVDLLAPCSDADDLHRGVQPEPLLARLGGGRDVLGRPHLPVPRRILPGGGHRTRFDPADRRRRGTDVPLVRDGGGAGARQRLCTADPRVERGALLHGHHDLDERVRVPPR